MEVGIRTRIQPRCTDCGVREAMIAAYQMAHRSGPYYQRFLEKRWPNKYARGTGTPRPD